jgi:hypothetical protein
VMIQTKLMGCLDVDVGHDVRIRSNGMDRSCAATIYPVLDKPRTTGAFQDRRKIEALLRPA